MRAGEHQFESDPPALNGELASRLSAWTVLAGAALIATVAVLVYWPALRGGFILDDDLYLTNNRLIHAPNGLALFWFTAQSLDYYPLSNSTLWLEWRLWGNDPTGYHVTNLLLHIAGCLLLWRLLRKLSVPGAFLAAMLFAVHPVNVESVAWIAQRKNVLAMVFFLLSILWFVRGAGLEARGEGREEAKRALWYWISLLAFLLAMLCKGSVVILPAVLLGLIWWRQGRISLGGLVSVAPFCVVAIGLAGLNMSFWNRGSDEAVRGTDFAQRLAGAGEVVWFYLSKALTPLELIFIYPPWDIQTRELLWWLPLLSGIAVTVVFGWRGMRRGARWARALWFGWLMYCVALLPVLGLTEAGAKAGFLMVTPVSDHHQHIALLAVVTVVAAGIGIWLERARGSARAAPMFAALAIVAALGALCWRQSALYASPIKLYSAALERNPDSWLLHNDLAGALSDAGQMDEAILHCRKALEFNPPNRAQVLCILGDLYLKAQRPEEAMEQYQEALRLRPDFPLAHTSLGNVLLQTGQPEEAMRHFQQAVQQDPRYALAHFNLANYFLGVQKLPEAIEQFQQTLQLEPEHVGAHYNLGLALANAGQMTQAMEQFHQVVKLAPQYAEGHNNLGNALMQSGRAQEAIPQFLAAARLKPGDSTAYFNLSKAFAGVNRLQDAAVAAQEALRVARAAGQTSQAEQIEDWLKSLPEEYRKPTAGAHGGDFVPAAP